MNVYSDASHSALKYLKNTEVNIRNLLIMVGDFNIRVLQISYSLVVILELSGVLEVQYKEIMISSINKNN